MLVDDNEEEEGREELESKEELVDISVENRGRNVAVKYFNVP